MITDHHAKYFAHELTRLISGEDIERLSASMFDASIDLNPHQIEAALFALRSPLSKGVILADEVGLGKTIEAGLVLSQYWAERKRNLLIICPASLRRQWAAELTEKFNLPTQILDVATVRQLKKEGVYRPFQQNKIIILSYHYASRLEDELRAIPYNLVVFDEAHKLRNAHQKSNRMGQTLARALSGRQKLLLTATPLQNSLMELFGLTSLIDEHIFGDPKAFRKQYLHASGNLGELRDRLSAFSKRTLRKDVLEYIRYTERRTFTQPYVPSIDEQRLYDTLTAFLMREESYALPVRQRHLTTLILRKLLASSTYAVTGTLVRIKERLTKLIDNQATNGGLEFDNFLSGLIQIDEIENEYLEQLEKTEAESAEEKQIDLDLLQTEIDELSEYIELAESITIDAKTEQLLQAIETGFAEMEKIGGARKAIIFTESRRTQEYLQRYLDENGYQGKLVTFNGTNTDPQSTEIYQQWWKNPENRDKISGSKPVDRRTAIIDFFRDDGEIMIATEAAAEGINLQFCSLVINYDLPWNPQRVEQRIGRCHRYGQKHDVVVINFVNENNSADQRVLELLSDKFNLFTGVFGSSDDVLGKIESGIDFEKRILEIYQTCRTQDEIQYGFKQLQKELEEQISNKMEDTQQLLMEHFDEDIHDLLKLQLAKATQRLDRMSRMFWRSSKHIINGRAQFNDEQHDFILNQPPTKEINPGHYQLVSKNSRDRESSAEHIYRMNHPLGEHVIEQAKERETPDSLIRFDISHHEGKISLIEEMKGQTGWLALDLLRIDSFQSEEHLIFTGLNSQGTPIEQEVCEKLFQCDSDGEPRVINHTTPPNLLEQNSKRHQESVISSVIDINNRFFQEERDKLEKWADDKILASEQDLQDTKSRIKGLKRESRQAATMEAQQAIQKDIREMEKRQRRQRQQIFDVEDEIIEKRDDLIDSLEQRMTRHTMSERLFTIQWEVV